MAPSRSMEPLTAKDLLLQVNPMALSVVIAILTLGSYLKTLRQHYPPVDRGFTLGLGKFWSCWLDTLLYGVHQILALLLMTALPLRYSVEDRFNGIFQWTLFDLLVGCFGKSELGLCFQL